MRFSFTRFRFTCAFLLIVCTFIALPLAARQQRNPQQQQQQRQGTTPQQQTAKPQSAPAREAQTDAPPSQDDTAPQDDDEIITVESDLTNILFTALDKQKRFVSTLQQADIRVLEDGVPQEIFTFQKQVDLPLSLAIVIDTSGSQERTLPEEKAAALGFISSVLRQRKDEAAVLTFTGETTLEQSLTGNTARVRSAIERVRFIPASGVVNGQVVGTPPISGTSQAIAASTALWDAVWVTAKDVLTDAPPRTRRAIILLTDGINTYGQYKLADAVAQAVKSEVSVYAIGIGDDFIDGVDEGSLRKLTERTGGRAYFPRSAEELDESFKQIERELREQYLVAYSPKNKTRDDRLREVKIEIVNPELVKQKMKLTYRSGYFRRPTGTVGAAGAK